MNTMSLFDLPAETKAALAQEAGRAAAVAHAGQSWVDYATVYVHLYLIDNAYLFCDDVWAHGLARPESPRAFGQAVKNAIRNGWMTKTTEARPSVNSNMSLRSVYRSTIYDSAPKCVYPTWATNRQGNDA
jgi:hypothetical protein